LMTDVTDNAVAVVAHGTVICTWVGQQLDIDPIPLWQGMGIPWFVEIDWPNPTGISLQMSFE
jgi:hypothetical protein